MADGDLENHLIAKCALEEVGFRGIFKGVKGGTELMDFLFLRGKHRHQGTPDLILLDIDIPLRDGRSLLQEIKADLSLRPIAVAVMASSSSNADAEFCSRFRKCSYTRKPTDYHGWTRCLLEILIEHLPSWRPGVLMVDEAAHYCERQ
ncbi:MAG: response regulator [Desulfobacteraceae bacterium]|nr:MAG: response regulator [Desulfobacteraceae bacterium]